MISKTLLPAVICFVASALFLKGDSLELLKKSGVKGGVVVCVGCDDPAELAQLKSGSAFAVQGIDNDPVRVRKCREYLLSKGLNGPVSAVVFNGKNLPYIDNLVNLLIVDAPGELTKEEIMRVVAPFGVALIAGEKFVKPFPKEMDDWPQYLNKADNNAVSSDQLVGPPRHLQWVTCPSWSRSHMTIPSINSRVTSHGRLFTIEDRATPENPYLPGRFSLVARDAFNGVLLWEHKIKRWEPITRYVKDVAVQLQKRIAVVGDKLYCTPGITAPVTEFDAATGKILKVFSDTQETQELSYYDGVVYAVVGDRMNAGGETYNRVKDYSGKGINTGGSDKSETARFSGSGFSEGYVPEFKNKDNPVCGIVAIDAVSGKKLWHEPGITNYVAATLALDGEYAVYMFAGQVKCLDAKTGEKLWLQKLPAAGKSKNPRDGTSSDVLVVSGRRVYATKGGKFSVLSLKV